MDRREQIAAELNRLAKAANAIQIRYSAFMQLHSAASLQGDGDELVQRRDELHSMLDMLLDNGEQIERLRRELETLS